MSRLVSFKLIAPNTIQMTVFMKQTFISLTIFTIAMMVGGGLFAQTPCDPNGDGNPDGEHDTEGGGQGTGAILAGDLAWDALLNTDCGSGPTGIWDEVQAICMSSPYSLGRPGFNRVKIAIVDSGIRPTGTGAFNNTLLTSHTVSSDGVVTNEVSHPHPHGTYSASIIDALMAGSRSQTNYEYVDYQVLNSELRTSLAAVVAAIDHAVIANVDLIALSLGFKPTECDGIDWNNPSSPLYAALERARLQGVIVITSAGNDGNDLSSHPQYPAAYTALENVVSIGALDCNVEEPTSFSNFGAEVVDLFTIGALVRAYYNGCTHDINGTSFSTSVVAGRAAMLLTRESNAETVLCLLRSQTKPFIKEQYSIYGIVDAQPEQNNSSCSLSGQTEGSGPEFSKSLASKDLIVSPNPFNDQLDITINDHKGRATISLFNSQGQRILAQEVKKTDINLDLSKLSAGVYWLTVQDANGSQTQTIVKK